MKNQIIGLNEKGINHALKMLKKYYKHFGKPNHNVKYHLEEISQKISNSDNLSYEINSFETISGRPELITFDHSEVKKENL